MIIALTGGTGFVGGHVIEALIAAGHSIRALERRSGRIAQRGWNPKNITCVTGSLRDHDALDELMAGADAVIHLASALAAPRREDFFKANADGARNVALSARLAKVKRFVHVSSLAARSPDLSAYAASKRAAEDVAIPVTLKGEAAWTILRPPAVYGQADRATFPLIKQLAGRRCFVPGSDGARFSLLHVKDLAEALLHLVANDEAVGRICDLDDGRANGYNWAEVAALAAEVTGRKPRLHLLPRRVLEWPAKGAELTSRLLNRPIMLSPEKLNELYHPDWVIGPESLPKYTSWRPRIPFQAGFDQTLNWYISNGWMRQPGAMKTGAAACRTMDKI